MQLGWCLRRRYCLFGGKARLFHVHPILDEIVHLEGDPRPSRTKDQEPLKEPLEGFWHKHFFDPQFAAQNLKAEIENSDRFDRLWYRDFVRELERRTGKPWIGATLDDDAAGLLAYAFTIGAFRQRAGALTAGASSRMTGEWIIYTHEGGRRVYLTLALHSEAQASIIERLLLIGEEFPFVLERLRMNGAVVA